MNNEQQRSYNGGKFDGQNAASFKNPPHRSWPRDAEGKLAHFNQDYFRGYCEGYKSVTGLEVV